MIADDDPVVAGGGDTGRVLQRISAQLDGITAKLPVIEARESRLIFWGRIAVIAAVIGLAVAYALGYAAWHQAIARSDAQDAHIARLEQQDAAHTRANCLAGNQVRARDLKAQERFTRYVRATASHPGSPAVRAEEEQILAMFRVKDRPRPCPK